MNEKEDLTKQIEYARRYGFSIKKMGMGKNTKAMVIVSDKSPIAGTNLHRLILVSMTYLYDCTLEDFDTLIKQAIEDYLKSQEDKKTDLYDTYYYRDDALEDEPVKKISKKEN